MTRLFELAHTDPLAQGALVALGIVVLATIGLFIFILTRRNTTTKG